MSINFIASALAAITYNESENSAFEIIATFPDKPTRQNIPLPKQMGLQFRTESIHNPFTATSLWSATSSTVS